LAGDGVRAAAWGSEGGMRTYALRRILLLIPIVWGVITIVFVVVHMLPGDPAAVLLGPFATAAREEALRAQWGLNQPLPVQYVQYLVNVVHGNFGTSYLTNQSAALQIELALPYTLVLGICSVVIAVAVGIPLGIVAAVRVSTWIDHTSVILSLLELAAPSFYIGILLLLVFSGKLGWFPAIGGGNFSNFGDLMAHTILPAIALGAGLHAFLTRITRSSLLTVLHEDYIRTARSKGLSGRIVIYKHALRNAMLPVMAVLGLNLASIVGGTVIIETVFARPGIGSLLVNSVTGRDYIQVQACVLVLAFSFVLVNLLTDLAYGLVDPRIQYR
jgi:ABC-type dipeptide/oligopeptide/nickel transport system permease component